MFNAAFGPDWKESWRITKLSFRGNRFVWVEEASGNGVLEIQSDSSASAAWSALQASVSHAGRLSWRWRVQPGFDNQHDERRMAGDDFRARVLVSFDAPIDDPMARAICYVWAAREPVGSTFRNPNHPNVQTIVVRSGDERASEWVDERRDVVRDFERAFGKRPSVLNAIGLMVDTDDTAAQTRTRFDDIVIGGR